ncbi:MAG: DNA polymerase III subunit chi [Pseudomonadota bacterium]
MAKVDFYILKQSDPSARTQFSCRLASKVYALEHKVHVRTESDQDAEALDQLMWTFDDAAFVPHEIWRGGAREAPVTIASADVPPPSDTEVVINLANSTPAQGAWRIAEILDADPETRAAGRQRFAGYRDAGHELDTHKI